MKSVLKSHNQELYKEMESCLQTKGKALLILGTGLGKTTTVLEYLQAHNKQALVICPNHVVCSSWYTVYTTPITFSRFQSYYKRWNYKDVDLVIIDEVHHATAEKWGEGIKYLLDNKLVPVVGLTATPLRSDGVNVKELFEDAVCQGLDVLEGIKKGILYPFSYVGAYYDTDKIIKQSGKYYSKLDTKLRGQLDLSLNNIPPVQKILTTHMPEGARKGIVFVNKISEIEEAQALLRDTFPNIPQHSLHSQMSGSEIREAKEWFYNTTEGFLFTVYMMGEGAHYPGVNTLIMLRRTGSNLVFTQQLGRCLTLSEDYPNPNAIVFDLVNNGRNLKNFVHKLSETTHRGKAAEDIHSSQIIIKSYTEEIDNILERISEIYGWGWSEEENNILREQYPHYGVDIPALNYKSKRTILRQAKNLGLTRATIRVSDADKQLIIKYYPTEGVQCVNRLSTWRSGSYLSKFARKLGLRFETGRKVRCVETQKEYTSAAEAGRELKVRASRILGCASGKKDHITAAGYHWEFV